MEQYLDDPGSQQFIISVVEDDLSLNRLIQKTLEKEGYVTRGFLSGAEAHGWLSSNSNQDTLILLDYQLADIQGEELIKQLRKENLDLPFVIITGHGDERTAVEMMKLGALDYMVKDNSFIDLLPSVIHQVVSRLSIQKQLVESQEALRQSEEKYRSIFENIQDVYFELTLEGNVIELSPSIEQIFLYHKEDLLGKPLFGEKSKLDLFFEQLNEKGSMSDFEMVLNRKNKESVPCSITSKYIYDHDGNAIMIVGSIRDISERKQVEESLRISEERYRVLAENSSDMISKHSWDATYIYVSPASKRLLGYEPEEIVGHSAYVFIHPDDIDKVRRNHIGLLETHQDNSIESYRIRKKNGEYIWFETNNQVIFNAKTALVEEIVCVSRDVTLRKEKEELRKAMEVAERSNRVKSEFLANMSHEIRNPLNAIIGMTRTLGKTNTDKEQQSIINSILISAGNLLHILNDILDYSKIEANKIDLTFADFDLQKALNETLSVFEPQASEKNIELAVQFGEGVPKWIHGDEKKICQVLNNLLSNAIKFTNEGKIEIGVENKSVQKENIRLEFYVKDTGIGVKEEDIPRLFESFRQLDISARKEYQGTGLGLNIVKSLVEMMNGEVKFESEYGVGSRISFNIPLVMARDQETDMEQTAEETLEMEKRLSNLHILVAEDDAINQLYLAGFLRSQGWTVDTAANGLVAIEKFASNAYDLVLMDGQMPKMDGFETARRIREMEKDTGKHVPIVAITGYAIPGDRERFMDAGMDDYVSKPIDERKLIDIINRMTG
ncbi:MAG: response regulator [Bacteroides sp.]|jgi:PAS domain S-box-containing protein|nr:response regulator [Bacteroides sp.]